MIFIHKTTGEFVEVWHISGDGPVNHCATFNNGKSWYNRMNVEELKNNYEFMEVL